MNPKFRWLLHKAVEENFPDLFTFSVGEENLEQVVVCRVETILSKVRSGDCTHDKALSWVEKKYGCKKQVIAVWKEDCTKRLSMKTCQQETQRETPKRTRETVRPGAQGETRKPSRHPDIQLYVPRARRSAPIGQKTVDTTLATPDNVSVKTPNRQISSKHAPATCNNTVKSEALHQQPSSASKEKELTISVKDDVTNNVCSSATEQLAVGNKLNPSKTICELYDETQSDCNNEDLCIFDNGSITSSHFVKVNSDNQNQTVESKNYNLQSNSSLKYNRTLEPCAVSDKKVQESVLPKMNSTLKNDRTLEPCAVSDKNVQQRVLPKSCEQIAGSILNDDPCCGDFPNRNRTSSVPTPTSMEYTSIALSNSKPKILPETIKPSSSVSSSSSSSSPAVHLPKVKERSEVNEISQHPLTSSDSGIDSWDNLFDENGDCLQPSVMEGLKSALGKVDITKPKIDYLNFQALEPDMSDECYDHILELYDFPVEFKTQNLMMAFSAFKDRGFDIKWVDDTHALAIFSSPVAASEALDLQIPFIKTRPMSQAFSKSKNIVYKKLDYMLPTRPRPETSASLARRMITGALGVRSPLSREQREMERRKLQAAKEIKRQVAKQKQDIWNGTVS